MRLLPPLRHQHFSAFDHISFQFMTLQQTLVLIELIIVQGQCEKLQELFTACMVAAVACELL